ncbi:MAG: histidinol-phosphate transaminase [Arenicellales bacterium]|nr:histidinol-phosphate transaminase [Arenicellales bacterium]MDP6312904.1 histidinol-phosphate transaminase [Arenicellales bacterium]MDP7490677.1 histidinol-phosphate transaminase [Arenicellales bacterium]MDP7569288.1 histidinol-phosphate transaminase [Arenicellales bacterium]HJP45891.1 histidinol-phosphate transaminase [Arenicellales bacterium]
MPGPDIQKMTVPGVRQLQPYLPGKPTEELERELGIQSIIKMASNENPLGPPARVRQIIAEQTHGLARYPDDSGFQFKSALAAYLGVDAGQITFGNGSSQVLELVVRAFVQPGERVVMSEYAFVVYSLAAQAVDADLVVVPAKNWAHDLETMAASVDANTRVVFIANPNNPTGTWIDCVALEAFLKRMPDHVVTVVDEAYFEYVDDADFPDAVALLRRWPGLIATRTFSKIYALAGLRIGYAVASSGITEVLNRVRQPFNVNSLGLVAASEALTETEFVQHSRRINKAGMVQLCQGFQKLGLEYIPSKGNFISVDVGGPAEAVYERLLRQGVIVRPVANYGMPQHLRITIGLEQENDQALTALETALAR